MSYLLAKHDIPAAQSFNGDISNWDASRVTNMKGMFYEATSFNADLSKWDVSRVPNMFYMFYSATSFTGDLSKWDVSRVTIMFGMFHGASSFAQTLCGAWSTSTADKTDMFSYSRGRLCLGTSTSKTISIKAPTLTLTNHNPGCDP